ncbi:MAG: hypothetical protein KGH69_04330 [Candidatus Micrarchaeota archaeon]|nr:hypothetical protein [Candidatus Micrarchaeota archaeon]
MGMFKGIERKGLDYHSTGYFMDLAVASRKDALDTHRALMRMSRHNGSNAADLNGRKRVQEAEMRRLIADARGEYGSTRHYLEELAGKGASEDIRRTALKEIIVVDRLARSLPQIQSNEQL